MKRNTLFGTTLERKTVSDIPWTENTDDCRIETASEPLLSAKFNYEQHKLKLGEIDKCLKVKENESKLCVIDGHYELPKVKDTNCVEKKWKFKCLPHESYKKQVETVNILEDNSLHDIILRHIAQRRSNKEIRGGKLSNRLILETSGLEIPRNICHQFRYSFCDKVLSKEDFPIHRKPKVTKDNDEKNKLQVKTLTLSEYDRLGNIMRSNIFPMPTLPEIQKSHYKRFYNAWDTFEKRDITLPQKFRFIADDLSKWSAACIVQKKIYSEWQKKYDEVTKKRTMEQVT